MALTRVWSGNVDGDAQDPLNWRPISCRSSRYKWTVTGTAGEYYLELAAGGDPSLAAPSKLYYNGTEVTTGTIGSLAANRWAYGATGAGFDSIIYRTSGTADPDTLAIDSIVAYAVPASGDSVVVPAGAGKINENLDLSAISLVDWIVEDGFENNIGSATAYLNLTLSGRFSFAGSAGVSYINLGASAISAEVLKTGFSTTARGLNLLGSALATVEIAGGQVGIAALPGETATVTTVRVSGKSASVWIGPGASLTTYYQQDGNACLLRCAATTATVYAGTLTTDDVGAITTLNVNGGTVACNSTGTITTLNLSGGTCDFSRSALPRTVTTLNHNLGSLWLDKNVVTVTTYNLPSKPMTVAIAAQAA